jgi:hypothetical protein
MNILHIDAALIRNYTAAIFRGQSSKSSLRLRHAQASSGSSQMKHSARLQHLREASHY